MHGSQHCNDHQEHKDFLTHRFAPASCPVLRLCTASPLCLLAGGPTDDPTGVWSNAISSLHPTTPNNRFTGSFSWINPYRRPFFLIKCCHRVLSGIFSGIITAASILLGVYQEFPAKHRPDAWSIVLSSVR